MKKRLLSLTLAVVMAAGALAGCGGDVYKRQELYLQEDPAHACIH